MFSPGGFDGTVEKWTTAGVYARTRMLEHLSRKYRCIVFDRRECGQSGGRVEHLTWAHYVAQGKGLLEHLGIERAHLLGGCMGCCPVMAFGVAHPQATLSMILWWPVGGAKYRIKGQQRFAEHLTYVQQHGLAEVVSLATSGTKSFGEDPRAGPWCSVIRHDRAFAESFAKQDMERYKLIVQGMARALVEAASGAGSQAQFFEMAEEAGERLARELRPGDAVLFKASRGVKLERALEVLQRKMEPQPRAQAAGV